MEKKLSGQTFAYTLSSYSQLASKQWVHKQLPEVLRELEKRVRTHANNVIENSYIRIYRKRKKERLWLRTKKCVQDDTVIL